MKKLVSLFIISIFLILSLFVCVSIASSSEKTIELTLAENTPPTGLKGEAAKLFIEEVEKHTNGRVKIEVFWARSLLSGKEILSGVQNGVVDIGYINPAYYPQRLLLNDSLATFPRGPIAYNNVSELIKRISEEVPELDNELEVLNQKILYRYLSSPMGFASTKPMTSFEDIRGKKIRAPSQWFLKQLQGAGAIPVSIPWGDVYMSLDTGVIDAVYTGVESIHRVSLEEAAPYIFTTNKYLWGCTIFLYTINKDKFNSLPEDIQLQLVEAGEAAGKRYGDLFDAEWDKILKEQEGMDNVVVNHFSTEDLQKWMDMPVIGELKEVAIKLAKEKGIENPEQIFEKLQIIFDETLARERE